MLSETKQELQALRTRIDEARQYLDLENQRAKIAEMEKQTQVQDFWDEPDAAQTFMKKLNQVRHVVEPWTEADTECQALEELVELLETEEDAETQKEVEQNTKQLARRLEKLEFQAMLSEETDPNNAYLQVHAGAGGTESCDWASMLLRMYMRWCENHGYETKEIEFLPGDEAGVKGVTILVKGDFAFGYLKSEIGVHRLVRISPFDSASRRHTSFASVFVTPEIEDDIDIEISDDDLRVDTYRSSGAGGQHVNKTDSAIRITHEPTGIVVSCQNERSQHKNRATAMKVLRARLYQLEVQKRKEEQSKIEDEKMEIGWGSQIRSYVFQPYQMVKDLRTGEETGNIQAVMDGGIDRFMEAYLRHQAGQGAKESA
ncbi:MAG: peptide chain release factor 2 [Candidatus Sumerlaeota bacterium]